MFSTPEVLKSLVPSIEFQTTSRLFGESISSGQDIVHAQMLAVITEHLFAGAELVCCTKLERMHMHIGLVARLHSGHRLI